MTDVIQPFHRLSGSTDDAEHIETSWTLRVMRLHFVVAGLLLFGAALGVVGSAYADFDRIQIGHDLRITQPGDIYERDIQLRLVFSLALGLISLIPFRAVSRLARQRRSAVLLSRLAAGLLMAGLPVGVLIWQWVANLPESPEDMTTVQQLVNDVSLGVQILALVVIVQAVLALWYQVWLSFGRMRRALALDDVSRNLPLSRLQRTTGVVWLFLMIGLGAVLGVMTDWLYEIPVPKPDPGELLYATSFDDFNDEWDLFPGRDAAQVVSATALQLTGGGSQAAPLAGDVLLIKHGSGVPDEVIWSSINRKFGDMDVRVTARLIDGPVDQNQFGIIFRYRYAEDFYVFRISADGYYSLTKVRNGVQEKISDWGISDAIIQGEMANVIRVVARGDEFRFFINGQPVPLCMKGENETSMWANWEGPGICFTDELRYVYKDGAFTQGRVALTAGTIDGSEIRVAFDDLVIVGPDPDVMTVGIEQ